MGYPGCVRAGASLGIEQHAFFDIQIVVGRGTVDKRGLVTGLSNLEETGEISVVQLTRRQHPVLHTGN
jgi:hypothetical protein